MPNFLEGNIGPDTMQGVGRYKLCHMKLGDSGEGSALLEFVSLSVQKSTVPPQGAVVKGTQGCS